MKSAIIFIALTAFGVAAYAQNEFLENGDSLVEVAQINSCEMSIASCEVVVNGSADYVLYADMYKTIPMYVGPISGNVHCEGPVCYKSFGSNKSIGLNPNFKWDDYVSDSSVSQQPTASEQPVQQASEPPYKLAMEDGVNSVNPVDRAVKFVVISTSNDLIVEKITINEGSCAKWDRKYDIVMKQRPVLGMGRSIKIPLMNCEFIKADIETNKGSWTHSI